MKRFDQINVIPFIDIMLVLLAIVLTTATFITQGKIDVNLPQANSASPATEEAISKRVITIDARQQLYLDDEPTNTDKLSAALENTAKKTPIVLKVDKQVPFEKFVGVIDLLKTNQLEKFSIITIEK